MKSRVLWSFDRMCKWEWDFVFVCVHSPSGSISCSCCGNLQEVVTDTEATHTSPEENLTHTHSICLVFTSYSITFVLRVPHDSVNYPTRHITEVCLPSSSLCEVHTTSRQIFLSISTSASKKESTSSSVMSPVQTSLFIIVIITTNVWILIVWLHPKLYGTIFLYHKIQSFSVVIKESPSSE